MNKNIKPETRLRPSRAYGPEGNSKLETVNPDLVFIPQSLRAVGPYGPEAAFRNPHSNRFPATLHDSRGTTLIEVLMASVIFMIGMLALLGMQVISMHSNKFGQEMGEATALVSDQVEKLWLDDSIIPGTYPDPNNPVDGQGQPGGKYTRTWTAALDPNFAGSERITVTVSWTDIYAFGKTRSVNFTYAR